MPGVLHPSAMSEAAWQAYRNDYYLDHLQHVAQRIAARLKRLLPLALDDLLAEAALACLQSLATVPADCRNIAGWIYRQAYFDVLDACRKGCRRAPALYRQPFHDSQESLAHVDDRDEVDHLLSILTNDQRRVCRLHYWQSRTLRSLTTRESDAGVLHRGAMSRLRHQECHEYQ